VSALFTHATIGFFGGSADIARQLFHRYANQTRYLREEFVKLEIVRELRKAIATHAEATVQYKGKTLRIEPCFLAHSKGQSRAYLVAFVADLQFRSLRIANIESISVRAKDSARHWLDPKLAGISRGHRLHFDAFLSYGHTVQAKLTPEGEALLNRIVTNRPTWLPEQVKDGLYLFQCSLLQAQIYFPAFFQNVEILDPPELREWFRSRHEAALGMYQNPIELPK
jgi:predicted DNA-binding transcriptional regulator YafY